MSISMAAWRAERPDIGRNKPRRQISKTSGMPPGLVGESRMGRQAAGGHEDAYRGQRGHTPQQRNAQPGREREFFNDDVGY